MVVSGKLRGQRAKAMKFVDGLMIHSGNPAEEYVDTAVRHVLLRQVRGGIWREGGIYRQRQTREIQERRASELSFHFRAFREFWASR